MNRPIIYIALLGSLALATGCQTTTPTARSDIDRGATIDVTADATPEATAVLWVKGIGCPFCVPSIDGPLTALPGVESVHVDLPTGKVTIALNPEQPASRQALVNAIDESGFTLDRIEMPEQ